MRSLRCVCPNNAIVSSSCTTPDGTDVKLFVSLRWCGESSQEGRQLEVGNVGYGSGCWWYSTSLIAGNTVSCSLR